MKKFALCVMALLSMTCAMAQQKSHTVQRGETLESIAQKYNVSVSALKSANPDAADVVYVGMKLNIPTNAGSYNPTQTQTQTQTATTTTTTSGSTYATVKSGSTSSYSGGNAGNFEFEVQAGLSLNNYTGKDVENADMKVGFHGGLKGRYFFSNSFYADAGVLFATKGYKSKKNGVEVTMDTYNIDVPVNVGVAFNLSDNMRMRIFAGPYLTYALSGEQKIKGTGQGGDDNQGNQGGQGGQGAQGGEGGQGGQGGEGGQGGQGGEGGQQGPPPPGGDQGGQSRVTRADGPPSSGVVDDQPSNGGSGTVTYKLKDMKGFNKMNVGFNVGVALDLGNFVVSAQYQRGLGKLYEKSKVYEQNILFTLGYKF